MGNPSLLPQCPRRPFLPLPGNAPRGEPSLDPVSPPCLIPTPGNLHHYCYERCQKCGSDNFLRHLDNSWRLGQDQQGPLGSLCVCVCVSWYVSVYLSVSLMYVSIVLSLCFFFLKNVLLFFFFNIYLFGCSES